MKLKSNQISHLITNSSVISSITDPANWSGSTYSGSILGLLENNIYVDFDYYYQFVGGVLTRLSRTTSLVPFVRQRKVIGIVDASVIPPTENVGDRYILDSSTPVELSWDGANNSDIVEFDGTSWVATTPEEGFVSYSDSDNNDVLFVDDGTPIREVIATRTTPVITGPGSNDVVPTEKAVVDYIPTVNHNALANKQGGTTNSYLHYRIAADFAGLGTGTVVGELGVTEGDEKAYKRNGTNWILIGGSGGITYHNITHADLLVAITNSTLVKGDYYTITDYKTVQQMVTMEVLTHTTEALTVQALDVNVLSKNATSLDFPTDIIEYDPSKEDFTEETYGYRDYGTSYDDIVFSNFGTNTVDINIVLGDMYTILLDTDAGDSYSYDQTGLGVDFNLTVVGSVTTIEFLDGAIDLLSGDCYLEINSYVILGSTKGRIIKRVDTLNNNTFNYDWRTIQGKMFSCDLSLYTSWTANTRFVAGSVVTHAGSLYMCVAGASYSATFPFSDFETIFAGPGLATRRFTAMGDGFGGIDNSLLFLINPTASLYQNTFYSGFNCNIVSTNTLNYSVFRGFNINSTVVSEGCSFGSLTKCNINGSNIHTEPLSNTNIGYVNNSFLKGGSAGDSNISSIRNSYILDLGLSYVGEISNSFIKSLYNSKIGDLTYSYIKKIEAGSDIRVATGLCGNDCMGNTIHSATNMCFLNGTANNTYLSVYNATIGMRVNNSYYTGEIISASPNVITVDGTPYVINALVGKYVTSDEGAFGIILSNTVSSITFLPIWSDSITMNTGHFVMIFDPVAVNCSNNIVDRIEYSSFGGCMNTKFGKITTSSAYGFDSCDIGAIGNSVCSSPILHCVIARIVLSSIYGTTNTLFNGSNIGTIQSSVLYGEIGISSCNIGDIRLCNLYLSAGSNFYNSSIGSLHTISAGAKGAPIQTSITSCNLGHLINGFLDVGSGIYGCNIAKLDLVGATIDYTFAGVSGSLILYKDMSKVPNIDTEDTKLVYNAVSGGSNKLFVSQYDYATETQTITVV